MRLQFFTALALTAAVMAGGAAAETDTSSLKAFVQSCKDDAKACQAITLSAIISARNAKYGCIPKDLANEAASEKLFEWLKGPASSNPKYEAEPLSDLFWTGVDEIWPCKK